MGQTWVARRRQFLRRSRARPANTTRAAAASGSHRLTGNTFGVAMTLAGKADSSADVRRPASERLTRDDSVTRGGEAIWAVTGADDASCWTRPDDRVLWAVALPPEPGKRSPNTGSTDGAAPGTAIGPMGTSSPVGPTGPPGEPSSYVQSNSSPGPASSQAPGSGAGSGAGWSSGMYCGSTGVSSPVPGPLGASGPEPPDGSSPGSAPPPSVVVEVVGAGFRSVVVVVESRLLLLRVVVVVESRLPPSRVVVVVGHFLSLVVVVDSFSPFAVVDEVQPLLRVVVVVDPQESCSPVGSSSSAAAAEAVSSPAPDFPSPSP